MGKFSDSAQNSAFRRKLWSLLINVLCDHYDALEVVALPVWH